MPRVLERVQAVRDFRLASKRASTKKCADTPSRFYMENISEDNYLLVPRVSSERRSYIPIGYLSKDDLTSDSALIVPRATLYHFGVLTSRPHMDWMRLVAGRLKSDYRYSANIVYNNFPWPRPSEELQARIEETARTILDARELYPESSYADLYDEAVMPPELRRAHAANDRAVLAAYGLPEDADPMTVIALLMRLYREAVGC